MRHEALAMVEDGYGKDPALIGRLKVNLPRSGQLDECSLGTRCVMILRDGRKTMTAVLDKPDYAKVKREVRRLIDEFGITEPPIDPARIARGIGVNVFFVTFEAHKQNVSGFFDCDESAIFVNKDEYPLRQTFTIAHELGHKVLHEKWAKSSEYRVLLRDSAYVSDEFHEKEANAFAAHLLVPRTMLDRYYKRFNVEQLSTLFAVSVPMIKNRLSFEYGIR